MMVTKVELVDPLVVSSPSELSLAIFFSMASGNYIRPSPKRKLFS